MNFLDIIRGRWNRAHSLTLARIRLESTRDLLDDLVAEARDYGEVGCPMPENALQVHNHLIANKLAEVETLQARFLFLLEEAQNMPKARV